MSLPLASVRAKTAGRAGVPVKNSPTLRSAADFGNSGLHWRAILLGQRYWREVPTGGRKGLDPPMSPVRVRDALPLPYRRSHALPIAPRFQAADAKGEGVIATFSACAPLERSFSCCGGGVPHVPACGRGRGSACPRDRAAIASPLRPSSLCRHCSRHRGLGGCRDREPSRDEPDAA